MPGRSPWRGHLEALASGLAADELAAAAAAERPDGDLGWAAAAAGRVVDAKLAVELAAEGDGDAKDVLDHVGFHLGVGIASYVNVFNPEVVVIGGGFAEAGSSSSSRRAGWSPSARSPSRDEVEIVLAELGSAPAT